MVIVFRILNLLLWILDKMLSRVVYIEPCIRSLAYRVVYKSINIVSTIYQHFVFFAVFALYGAILSCCLTGAFTTRHSQVIVKYGLIGACLAVLANIVKLIMQKLTDIPNGLKCM